ncbi:MAG: UbiX family flavin prenyltransferase [Candidatus Nezhaarchaeota archaeon]|nr:UbiX family flavin prenyltransferase [Candidatus Nezhaarchaeota archaeon]
MRLVVGISGATGGVIGFRLLEVLREKGVETHVVLTKAAEQVLKVEHGISRGDVAKLAHRLYEINDFSAPIVSGSFRTNGMVVAPCSMKTLAGIVHGYSDNLLLRAADVTLKERRPLILVVRESPLSVVHLRNMLMAAEMGAVILPPMLAFYYKPRSVDEVVDYVVGRVLDALGLEHRLYARWSG